MESLTNHYIRQSILNSCSPMNDQLTRGSRLMMDCLVYLEVMSSLRVMIRRDLWNHV